MRWLSVAAAAKPGYDKNAMGKDRSGWRIALWGVGCGMLGGLVFTFLYYLYEQLTHPHPYNVLTLFGAPVFVIFGALLALLAAAWYSSD